MAASINSRDIAVNTDLSEEVWGKSSCSCWGGTEVDINDLIPAEELRDKSLDGLTNTCDKAVSVLRNTIKSLGTVLRNQKFQPGQFKDVFAVPIQNLEVGKTKLESLLVDIRAQYHDIHFSDDRYFLNTYLKVRDLKDWGYRFVDYASATVALAMIAVEAAKAQDTTSEQPSMAQHWGITGGFLVLSKILSAATDYRNKKTIEKEQRKNALLHLKYRCDKAKEAAAIIDVLRAFTRSVDEIDPTELRTQLKRSIRAIKEENGGVVSENIAQVIKKELSSLLEERIFKEAGSVALMQHRYERRLLKKIFEVWNGGHVRIGGEENDTGEDPMVQQQESAIVEASETTISTNPQLKEYFRDLNRRRFGSENAAGVLDWSLQQNQLGFTTNGNRSEELVESVLVNVASCGNEEKVEISATLQYGAGTQPNEHAAFQKDFSIQASSLLSPPNLFAAMNRHLETTRNAEDENIV